MSVLQTILVASLNILLVLNIIKDIKVVKLQKTIDIIFYKTNSLLAETTFLKKELSKLLDKKK